VNLPEALDRALRAYYPVDQVKTPSTRPVGLKARMGALEKRYGSGARAAAAAGIPARTWRDWKNGAHLPSPKSLRKVDTAYNRLIVAPKVARASTRKSVARFDITADVVCDPEGSRYKNSREYRKFRAMDVGAEGNRKVVTAWLHDGAVQAASVLVAEIKAAYQAEFAFEGNNVDVNVKK
jgi:hypothetical protein